MSTSMYLALAVVVFVIAVVNRSPLVATGSAIVAAAILINELAFASLTSPKRRIIRGPEPRPLVDSVEKIIRDCDKEVASNVFGRLVDWHSDIRYPQFQSVLTKSELDEYFERASRDELLPLVDPQGPYHDRSIQAELRMLGPDPWARGPVAIV